MLSSIRSTMRGVLQRNPVLLRAYGQLRESMELLPRRWRYRRQQERELSEEARAILATLRRDGIVILGGFVPPDAVGEMRGVVDDAIRRGRFRYDGGRIALEAPPPDVNGIARLSVLDATLYSRRFVEYALNDLLVSVANSYVGLECFLSGIMAYRTQPVTGVPGGAFLWHYDNTPRQVKAICYLTEVAEDDGPLAFVKGSHRLRAVAPTFEETRLADAQVPAEGRILCVGKPGTVLFVDTSGIHRATPNRRSHRDVVSAIYDVGTRARRASFYNLPVPSQFITQLRPEQRRALRLPEHVGW